MSFQQSEISASIKQKVQTLVNAFDKVKTENDELLNQNKQLKLLLEEKEKTYGELLKNYDRLKLAKAIEASSLDVHDARIKVNRIVREIDNCIALLNR